MLWASWMLRLLPAKSAHQPRIGGMRRACVNLMLIPGGPIGHRQATQLMGNSHFRSQQEALLAFVDADHIASALAHFAHVVDAHTVPIDYARRRNLFANESVELALDEKRHHEICRSFGSRQFTPVHQERARWQVRRLLLGPSPTEATTRPHGLTASPTGCIPISVPSSPIRPRPSSPPTESTNRCGGSRPTTGSTPSRCPSPRWASSRTAWPHS